MIRDTASDLTPKDIPMSDIYSDTDFNCRGVISAFDIRELQTDIEARGLQTPITIQPYSEMPGFKYRILAGHRRYAAFRSLERKTIPSIIREGLSEVDAIIFNFSENLKRKDLNPVQEAKTLEKLKFAGYNAHQTAKMIGQSLGWVQNRFNILDLPDDLQKEVEVGILKVEHIRKISKLQSVEQMYQAVREIKDAKIYGKKKEVDIDGIATKNQNKKVARSRTEINNMQELVYNVLGPSFITRALAWAQGEIDDIEVHEALKEAALKIGRNYSIPLHLRRKVKEPISS